MFKSNKVNVDYKLLIKLTIPIFLEIILQILIGNIDKLMVNNTICASAINEANTVIDMLTVSFSVLSSASLILINQFKGANNKDNENKIYSIAFYFNVFLSSLIGFILLIFAKNILNIMQVEEQYLSYSTLYLRINGGFIFLQAIMSTLACFLRSNDFVFKSLCVSFGFNIINISLNALFLYVFKINNPIIAVAIPSVISRVIACFVLVLMFNKYIKVDISFKSLKNFSFSFLRKILKIGLPSTGESLSYSLSQIVILSFINIIGFGAPEAKTYTQIMVYVAYLFTSAVSQGMQILLGRYLGAKKYEEANKLVLTSIFTSLIVSTIVTSIIYIFSNQIFDLLVPSNIDAESRLVIINLCKLVMFIEIFLEIGRSVNICLVRGLQTCGDAMFPTILAIIFCWLIAVLGGYYLGVYLGYGLKGIWIAMTIDELLRAIIFLIRWFNGKWKRINISN